MKATLKHTEFVEAGIMGEFTFDGDEAPFMVTLEHAYLQDDGSYAPKVTPGLYDCVRGVHALHNGQPFFTFEITGIEGHSGVLFHQGNYNKDSEGCVLCGKTEANDNMITNSVATFAAFMARLNGVNEFTLEVVNAA